LDLNGRMPFINQNTSQLQSLKESNKKIMPSSGSNDNIKHRK
jgi:hypothetical protein